MKRDIFFHYSYCWNFKMTCGLAVGAQVCPVCGVEVASETNCPNGKTWSRIFSVFNRGSPNSRLSKMAWLVKTNGKDLFLPAVSCEECMQFTVVSLVILCGRMIVCHCGGGTAVGDCPWYIEKLDCINVGWNLQRYLVVFWMQSLIIMAVLKASGEK